MKPLQGIAIFCTLYMLSERISWNSFAIQQSWHHGINLMKHRNVQQTPKGCVHLANNYHLSALFSFYPQPIGPHFPRSHAPEAETCSSALPPSSFANFAAAMAGRRAKLPEAKAPFGDLQVLLEGAFLSHKVEIYIGRIMENIWIP